MLVLFRKDQKFCATCINWNGSKELCDQAINTDFTSNGHCELPENALHDQRLACDHPCLKYTLCPALN